MNQRRDAEHGFTLVELMVSGLLLVIVLGMLGGFYISSVLTQQTIERSNQSSSQAQTAANTIANGIRNSTTFELSENVDSAGSQLLTAQVARGGNSVEWRCAAWYYDASNDELRYSEKTTMPTTPYSDWSLLASGVRPTGGAGVFALEGVSGVSIRFEVLLGDGPSAEIATVATTRMEERWGDECY